MSIRLAECAKAKVSSSTGKQYGKEKMFDGCPDTCWHSKEGKPQSISLEFDHVRCIRSFRIQFSGGFTPTECQVLVRGGDDSEAGADAAQGANRGADAASMDGAEKAKGSAKFVLAATVYPCNNSNVQVFELPAGTRAHTLKLLFVDSTDMFGRIVVYLLDVLGT